VPFTYTYTARNSENPNRVVTFTIYEDQLKVDLTGLVDQVTEVIDEEHREEALKEIISTQTGTALYKAIERLTGPAHINDVTPLYKDGKITITFWKRLAGLRFAPIVIVMGEVDNPDAANQFVEVLSERQEQTDSPGVFAGPLDYWFTWVAIVMVIVALVRWPRKKGSK
jgi:hypothetical protein